MYFLIIIFFSCTDFISLLGRSFFISRNETLIIILFFKKLPILNKIISFPLGCHPRQKLISLLRERSSMMAVVI